MAKHSPETIRLVHALKQAGVSQRKIAEQTNLTKPIVQDIIERLKPQPAEFDVIPVREPLTLIGDWIIAGDVHVPATSWEMACRVSRVAERTGINRLIIAGDLFNMDAFSIYPKSGRTTAWAQERDAARVLLRDWLEVFTEIVILTGNHDARLIKWADGQLEESDIFGMVIQNPKITTSPLSWCTITSGGQLWRVTHPGSYSRNQLIVASDLALQFQCNIISFHEHKLARGRDRYNRYTVVNGGMLADATRLDYTRMVDRASAAAMVQGFVMLRNGYATEYGDDSYTDWGAVLGRDN